MAWEFTRVFLAAVVETSCLPFSRASSAFRLTDLPEELALPRKEAIKFVRSRVGATYLGTTRILYVLITPVKCFGAPL